MFQDFTHTFISSSWSHLLPASVQLMRINNFTGFLYGNVRKKLTAKKRRTCLNFFLLFCLSFVFPVSVFISLLSFIKWISFQSHYETPLNRLLELINTLIFFFSFYFRYSSRLFIEKQDLAFSIFIFFNRIKWNKQNNLSVTEEPVKVTQINLVYMKRQCFYSRFRIISVINAFINDHIVLNWPEFATD